MERRKFLLGAGSLAAAGAAAMGTGAFSQVQAKRSLKVATAGDQEALLQLQRTGSSNSNTYTSYDGDDTLAIDLTGNAAGANEDAYTVIRDLFDIVNVGSQPVFVWASGLPQNVRMFHDGTAANDGQGGGLNQGAFSVSSNINANDPDDDSDPANPGGYEAAPKVELNAGNKLEAVGVIIDTRGSNTVADFDADISINAFSQDELNQQGL